MFLRGGLLIEPWKPFRRYTSDPKIQDIVIYDNIIYVCSETHQGGSTFNENSSKFRSTGINSGSDNGSLQSRYAGVWDLSQGSVQVTEAVPDPTLSSGFIKLNDAEFQFTGDVTPINLGSGYADYVVANGVSRINSGIRWGTVYMPDFDANSNSIFFGFCKNTQSPLDLLNPLLTGSSLIPVSGVLFGLSKSGNDIDLEAYILSNFLSPSNNTQFGINTFLNNAAIPTVGTPIHFGVDTATGDLFVQIDNSPPIQSASPLDLSGFVSDTFAPFYMPLWHNSTAFSAANPQTFKYDLGSTANGKLPFLSLDVVTTIPANAHDGEVYECVNGSATVNGTYVQSGDFVEFADSLSKLIVISKPKTTVQIEVIAQSKIDSNLLPNGAIKQAIDNAIITSKITQNFVNIHTLNSGTVNDDTDYVTLASNVDGAAFELILPDATQQKAGKRLVIASFTNVGYSSILVSTSNSAPITGIPLTNLTNQQIVVYEVFKIANAPVNNFRWVRIV